jgi:hypothetical protein
MNYIMNDLNNMLTPSSAYGIYPELLQMMQSAGIDGGAGGAVPMQGGGYGGGNYAPQRPMMNMPMSQGWQGVQDKLHYISQNLMARRQAMGGNPAGAGVGGGFGNPAGAAAGGGFGSLYDRIFGAGGIR